MTTVEKKCTNWLKATLLIYHRLSCDNNFCRFVTIIFFSFRVRALSIVLIRSHLRIFRTIIFNRETLLPLIECHSGNDVSSHRRFINWYYMEINQDSRSAVDCSCNWAICNWWEMILMLSSLRGIFKKIFLSHNSVDE